MPDQFDSGLMGMFYNPQTAGLLGAAQGLLAASGPSRLPISNGQALGMGLQGMQQGVNTGVQMQQNLLKMRAMQGLMGGDMGQQAQAQPQQPTSLLGVPSNPSSGLLSPTMAQSAPQPAQQQQPSQAPNSSIYGKTPQQLFQQGMLMNMAGIQGGGELMKIAVDHDPTLAAMMPTDITKMGVQGGMSPQDIQAANRMGVNKANYIAPVNARPGAILRDPMTMQPMAFNPHIPEGGTPLFDASGNVVGINSIPGATGVVSGMSAARTAGEGSMLPYAGRDAQGNPLPVTNRTAAATQQGATTPGQAAIVQTESGSNPNAVSPKGALGAWQVMPNTNANPGFGVTPARDNSPAELNRVGRDYYEAMNQRYGSPTLGAIAYNMGPGATDAWLRSGAQWEKLPQETRNYIGKVSTLTALNGMPQQPQQGQPAGAIYAEPPMGARTAADASQGAPSKQMADAYSTLSSSDANYQQSREALAEMLHLANSKGLSGGIVGGTLPESISTRISPDAAKYQKLHATYVALQGKALGSGGTDAARATIDEAVPTYDKPQSAMVSGLGTQLNNLDISHLKTQFLTPVYQRGDEKAFTQQSAAFDQNVKPSMAPVLMMNGPQQRAAVQAAIKANPSLRANFEWAFNNGLLK
jgi:hypothetical protein